MILYNLIIIICTVCSLSCLFVVYLVDLRNKKLINQVSDFMEREKKLYANNKKYTESQMDIIKNQNKIIQNQNKTIIDICTYIKNNNIDNNFNIDKILKEAK